MKRSICLTLFLFFIPFSLMRSTSDYDWNGSDLDWFRSGIGYQIYVSSFCDSNGDGIGDLKGLTGKLDYLNDGRPGGNDLGISVIWLTPIFTSSSVHGYDTLDYFSIDPRFGTMDDFKTLVKEADRRGIKIILDLVLNHCSDRHPIFEEAKEKDSPKRAWFTFSGKNKVWHTWRDTAFSKLGKNDYYWATFTRTMPDWNLANPEVTHYFYDIADFWLETGIGGFRLDAARHLIEEERGDTAETMNTSSTLKWLSAFRKHTYAVQPRSVVIAEIWDTPESVARYTDPAGGNITGGFNFEAQSALTRIREKGAEDYGSTLRTTSSLLRRPGTEIPFTSNHDMKRLANAFMSDDDRKAAARILLMSPGTPFIYYGDELGIESPSATDDAYRTAMSWNDGSSAGFGTRSPMNGLSKDKERLNVEAELKDPGSILNTYRETIALRASLPEYGLGEYVYLPSTREVLNFFVRTPHRRYFVAISISAAAQNLTVRDGDWRSGLYFTKDQMLTFTETGKKRGTFSQGNLGVIGPRELRVFEVQ
jgi:glycosidase